MPHVTTAPRLSESHHAIPDPANRGRRRTGSVRALVPGLLIAGLFTGLPAGIASAEEGSRLEEVPVALRRLPTLNVTIGNADPAAAPGQGEAEGGIAGPCPQQISTHTASNFQAGTYILQAGLGEGESAAVSFTLNPDNFPLRIDLTEMIFGTSGATVPTTTEWSWTVWEGTPATGTIVAQFSSLTGDLPAIVLPPGTSGANVQVMVDPNDPEQVIVTDNGSHTFSVGYTVVEHNQQTQNPCTFSPPTCCNAFPATDVGGLQAPTNNWLYALNCGPFGCPSGWKRFSELGLCQPSGDWVIRVTWTSYNCTSGPMGACCLADFCIDATQVECIAAGGVFQGDNSVCGGDTCSTVPSAGPCCFAATGGCIELPSETCVAAGGFPGTPGQSCASTICFPEGACCLPDGSCTDGVSPEACALLGGVFQGNDTTCATADCPEPVGACCFPTGFCLQLTETECALTGSTWAGPATTCEDNNSNGTPDGCEADAIPGDLDGDGDVDGADLGILLSQWQSSGSADLDGNGVVDGADLGILLSNWS